MFSAVWLPLYIIIGVSWMLAPSLAHEHYGLLRLISNEEAVRGAGKWYRLCDVLAGLILLTATLYFRLPRRTRYAGWALIAVVALSIIDGIFPDACNIGRGSCGTLSMVVSTVHDVETVLLGGLLAGLSIADMARTRRLPSIGFVALQLIAAVLVVSGLASEQFRTVLQYMYEFTIIVWLGWYVDGFNRAPVAITRLRWIRWLAAAFGAVAGITALVASTPHLRFVHQPEVLRLAYASFLLDQHGIISGVLLLYLSRHLLRGERPALWIALVVLASLVLKYSVFTPQPWAVLLYGLLFVSLLQARAGFNRNVVPPSWSSRGEDIGVVFGGVLVALLAILLVASVAGQQARLTHDVSDMYDYSYHTLDKRANRFQEHTEARLRALFETLLVSLGAITLWSLFRPRALSVGMQTEGMVEMRQLLERYSVSSEDYFKLWPADKRYFSPKNLSGSIAYRVQGGIAFMLADPVAPNRAARARLLGEFNGFARHHGWVVCALLVGEESSGLYEQVGMRTLQIGSSAVIGVEHFQTDTAHDKWWRWQRNRAAKTGWSYQTLTPPHSPETLQGLRRVSDAWLGREGRSEQGFALGYFDEHYMQQCSIYVLRDDSGAIVAFANRLPTYGKVRQATVDLIRFMPELSGAMPALLLHIIESLDPAVTKTFDLGFVPLARVDTDLARVARRLGSHRFASAGLEQFKNKFRPDWQPEYIAYDGDLLDLARIATNLEKLFAVDTGAGKRTIH